MDFFFFAKGIADIWENITLNLAITIPLRMNKEDENKKKEQNKVTKKELILNTGQRGNKTQRK